MVAEWVERALKVYRQEQATFLVVCALFFFTRASNILLENYVETTFLKRYGVEFLPHVFLLNSVFLFGLVGLVGFLMDRMARATLLRWMILLYAGCLVGLRALLASGVTLIYPVLYIFVAQSRYLMVVVFWVLGSDLFSSRQSKRLFPLIGAGGVLGVILGSAASGPLARLVGIDNVLLVGVALLLVAALVTLVLQTSAGYLLVRRPEEARIRADLAPGKAQWKELFALLKKSRFVHLVILLVALPNGLLPIFNYQWSVILDRRFVTEDGLLTFYAYFKAISNGLNLGLLMFVGRFFTRFGITTMLFLHPLNYLFIFGALLGSFTLPVGIYGRISASIFRVGAFRPAMYMLFGLIPPETRGRLVSFLQGAVGRTGALVGSVLLLASSPYIEPRYLALVGCLGAGGWLAATWALNRSYPKFLMDGLKAGRLDIREMEALDVSTLLDGKVVGKLLEAIRLEPDESAVSAAAGLLAKARSRKVIEEMLACAEARPEPLQIAILKAVEEVGPLRGLGPRLDQLAQGSSPPVASLCVELMGRLDADGSLDFIGRYIEHDSARARASAAWAAYRSSDSRLRKKAQACLLEMLSGREDEVREAVSAVAGSQEPELLARIVGLLEEADEELKVRIARALGSFDSGEALNGLLRLVEDQSALVRRHAAKALSQVPNPTDRVVDALIGRLDDDPSVASSAEEALVAIGDRAVQRLLADLAWAPVHRREALIRVLSELKVPERELVAPVRNEIEVAYSLALERCPLEHLSASQARDFLLEAIQEGVKERVRAALRLLRAAGPGREMDLINRSVFSEDRHTASIALEGLERMVQKEISRLLVPLIEERPTREVQSKAWGAFGLRPPSLEELLNRYLDSQDPVFQIGAKALLLEAHEAEAKGDGGLGALAFKDISSALLARLGGEAEKVSWMRDALSILEKVVFLRRVELFSALDVRALAAIATIAQERTLEPGEILCSEGEPGDSMFCIVEGQVEVLKSHPQGSGAKLAEVGSPEVLGEMALFDEKPRSATLKAGEKSTVLVIPRGAFLEIMREYPQVGISALKILSRRLREAGLRDLRPDGFVAPGERRRFPRVRVDMGVLVDRGQRVSLLNISQAGAYWEEDQPRIPGQRVSLEIEFPGRGSICLMGRVQRCQRLGHREGFGMAVVFEPMEGETERMFHEWLEAQGAGKSRA